jgi:conjugal transfer pilus assembly protein TraE
VRLARLIASWEGARAAARLLGAAVLAETAAIVVLAVLLVRQDRTVVMVSPDMSWQASVSRRAADAGYMKSWAFYLATVLGNVTPGNAAFVRTALAPLLCPEVYSDVMVGIEHELDQIARDSVSFRFEPRHLLTEPASGRVFVTGQAVTRAVTGGEERYQRTFQFRITVANYRPEVCEVASYRGAPRTAATQAAQPAGVQTGPMETGPAERGPAGAEKGS